MHSLTALQTIVEKEIESLSLDQEPAGLYAPIRYVLDIGGKRIRPALCLAAYQLFSKNTDFSEVLYPALGLEVFHNFTLLHDDLMDAASIRRNKKTVHLKWNANTAILSGDAMMVKASQYISKCQDKYLPEVLQVFNQTALEVCEGQQYDMDFENRLDVTVDEYLRMIRLKTSVLIAGSLKIGAIIGGASKDEANLLYDFGENIGIAFQLQDDFLDVYGDTETFGKAIGGDIVNNKKTFLLIQALQEATDSLKEELKNWIEKESGRDEEKIKAISSIYDALGIADTTKDLMMAYYDQGMQALHKVNIEATMKQDLEQFALKLIDRVR
jgi:geranylgeranyl diphosphate synthase type II